jgi:hypothetical protein
MTEYTNFWLIKKRQKLVGDRDFDPASYLQLSKFWEQATEEQYAKGRGYGKLRGLLDIAQGNNVYWTHQLAHHAITGRHLTHEQEEKVERLWRRVRARITPKEMTILDWLTQEPLSYDWNPRVLKERLRMSIEILDKL